MEKRNKLWRKRHQWRLFKAKMILMAANQAYWSKIVHKTTIID